MRLQDIKIKSAYYSDEDNLLREFYIPVLSSSIKYDRIAGYFSSNALAIAAKGIAAFIKAGGRIRLITNVVLSEEDQKAIKMGLLKKEKEILAEIENLEDKLKKDHIRMLGWMVKNDLLEIKIAVVKGGVEHQKIGILEDSDGNRIVFSGSDNETVQGWLHNDEQFHVFRSWVNGDDKHLLPDISRFEGLWQDKGNRVKVYSVSTAFEQGLIRIAPANDQEFQRLSHRITEQLIEEHENQYATAREKKQIPLWDYQKEAVQKWVDNGCKGIFEMATGTGKTFTALGCVKHLLEKGKKPVVIIATPYGHLVQQWQKEILKFGLVFDRLLIADSSNSMWRDELADGLVDMTLGHLDNMVILATHNTFASIDFERIIEKNKKSFPIILLADEVHRLGAEKSKSGLLELYDFRLALSATPKRWFDDLGTRVIYDYFGEVVFEFSLEEAINTVNPETNQTYLTPYKYVPAFISLEEEELDRYVSLTRSIVSRIGSSRGDMEYDEQVNILRFIRANVIKNASAKYQALERILDSEGHDIRWTIIYSTPEQIDRVMEIVNKRNIFAHRFTMDESAQPDDQYNGLSEREYILNKFADAEYQVLVAMKCLDEGVDIPQARTAILLASSGNPREYIQRIGRVIRRYPGKKVAVIYDVIVIPSLDKLPSELKEIEYNIFEKELLRYQEIAKIAVNNVDVFSQIYNIRERLYG